VRKQGASEEGLTDEGQRGARATMGRDVFFGVRDGGARAG
jgi:hypothetical protein